MPYQYHHFYVFMGTVHIMRRPEVRTGQAWRFAAPQYATDAATPL